MIKEWERQVRYVGKMTILFNTKETVYVNDGNNIVIVHRWFDKGRYVKHWKPFITRMKSGKFDTAYDVLKCARHYELSCQGATKMPAINGAKIIEEK